MTSLLDDELVKKYFGCLNHELTESEQEHMALRILKAMEEPIKSGERILVISQSNPLNIWEYDYPKDIDEIHSTWLRLPDRFQPPKVAEKKAEVLQCSHGIAWCIHCQGHPAEPPAPEARKCSGDYCREELGEDHDIRCPCACHNPTPPSAPSGEDEVEKIVDDVVEATFALPLGTNLAVAKEFIKLKLSKALARKTHE